MRELPQLYPLPFRLVDLERPEDLIPVLDDPTGEGERALEIASRLIVTEGRFAGERFGNVAAEWQRRLIRAIWGHRDAEGRRIIRRVVLTVARKAGKTTLASILGLVEVLMTDEQRGQVLVLAAQRDQARLTFKNWSEMIRRDPWLAQRFRVTDFRHQIVHAETGTELKALSTEASQVIGTGPSMAIVDELHLLGLMGEHGLDLVHGLESGMMARREPLMVYITTAPVSESRGIYLEVMSHARKVMAGEVDDRRTLAVMYEIPPQLDHEDPAHWWRSNPSLGVTVQLPDLVEQFERAKQRGVAAVAEFKSQNLNIEPADREGSASVWVQPSAWRAAEDPSVTLDSLIAQCTRIAVGIDAAAAHDLTAIAVLGRTQAGRYLLWTHHWLSKPGFDEQRNRGPFVEAQAAGELTVVPSVGDDIVGLLERIKALHASGKLMAVGADPYGLKDAAVQIQAITRKEVIGIPQSWRLSPHLDEVERAILSGNLVHHASALLDWQMTNAHVRYSGEARSLVKPNAIADSSRKIDAAIAMVCAWAAWHATPAKPEVTASSMFFV